MAPISEVMARAREHWKISALIVFVVVYLVMFSFLDGQPSR